MCGSSSRVRPHDIHRYTLGLQLGLDSRRAVFHIRDSLYSVKLVDLPCIIEAQKTLNSKQMSKVADICQVFRKTCSCCYKHLRTLRCLSSRNKVDSEDAIGSQKYFNINEFIWPHGITPPLHHVRKCWFRKRINKQGL